MDGIAPLDKTAPLLSCPDGGGRHQIGHRCPELERTSVRRPPISGKCRSANRRSLLPGDGRETIRTLRVWTTAMPDPTKLQVGDRIRLLRVPEQDLEQRERELGDDAEMPGYTADTIERIIAQDPVVTITRVEHGLPWFEHELKTPGGETEHHHLAIIDDASWEYA